MLKAGEPNTPRVLSDGDDRATARSARPCHLRPSPSLPHQATVCRKCFASTRGKLFASESITENSFATFVACQCHSMDEDHMETFGHVGECAATLSSTFAYARLADEIFASVCNSLVRPPQRDAIGWGPMLPFLSNTSRGTRKERRLVSILPGPPPLKRRDT